MVMSIAQVGLLACKSLFSFYIPTPMKREVFNIHLRYAYDIITRSGSHFIANKRLFAMCDTGIPDGIKSDTKGNIYSGCGDGVNVWSPGGKLIGKIYIPGGAANFCFGKEGEVFILNEHYMWRVQLNTEVRGALLGI